jgi:hypothetical protein
MGSRNELLGRPAILGHQIHELAIEVLGDARVRSLEVIAQLVGELAGDRQMCDGCANRRFDDRLRIWQRIRASGMPVLVHIPLEQSRVLDDDLLRVGRIERIHIEVFFSVLLWPALLWPTQWPGGVSGASARPCVPPRDGPAGPWFARRAAPPRGGRHEDDVQPPFAPGVPEPFVKPRRALRASAPG